MKNKKVASYCRVSTDKDDQKNSLKNQREYFREYIAKNEEWTLVDVYYDEGVSGTSTKKRTAFNRMIKDAMAGKIDVILTKSVSRFGRNIVDVLNICRMLKEKGVEVVFLTNGISTMDSKGELLLSILASLAQNESCDISDRVKWGQLRCMEKGVVFGRSLLGYDVKGGKLFIEPKGAEIVKEIFRKYVYENKGTHVIARELIEQGMKPMNVKNWSTTVILRVLRNEKYVGDLCQKKTYTPDYLTHKKKRNDGAEKKIYIENHHKGIINRNTWNKAQEILESRKLTAEEKSRYSNRYWCSGKVFCGDCGGRYVSRVKKLSGGKKYRAWKCSENTRYGTSKVNGNGDSVGCSNYSVNEKVLLKSVIFVMGYLRFNRQKLIANMKAELKAVMDLPQITTEYNEQEEIEKLEQKKRILLNLLLEGIVSKADYAKQNEMYDDEITELQKCARSKEDEYYTQKIEANRLDECIKKVEEYLSFDYPDEAICGEVVEKITVMNNHVLDVKLKYVPSVRVMFAASGRGNGYHVEFRVC